MIHGALTVNEAVMVALSGIVIVFLMLAMLWGVIAVVSRVVGGLQRKTEPSTAPAAPAPVMTPLPAIPQVVLEGIDDTQAACVMAIVSHETGIPLDQLIFKSIKAV